MRCRNQNSLLPSYLRVISPLVHAVWGLAMICWFVANANLELVIAFPIITMGPGLVNMIWGVVLFHEISGRRNFALLAASVSLYLVASVLIVLSKTPGSLG